METDWRNATAVTAPEPRGAVLHPRADDEAVRITRYAPSPALAPFVRHFWFVRWDLVGRAPHTQGTLPLPAANAVVELDVATVSGVQSRRFERALSGRGAVFGALFHPAGFQPFWGRSMHLLVDRAAPFAEVFDGDVAPLRAAAFGGADDAAVVAAYERFLLAASPTATAEGAAVDAWVARVAEDPSIARAEALAARVGVSLRALQRALRWHVGVGPKQVIRRHRLLEAAARVAAGEDVDHARLAVELGYSDQAHFVRDFSEAIGRSPGRYAGVAATARRAR